MRTARLASFLQIRPGEARMVALIAALFALIDASRGFGPNAVDALFFRRFGVEFLPYMYMGLGLVNFLVTLGYTAGLSRFDRRRFFVGLLLVLTLVLLLERAAILLNSPALYPVLWLTIKMLSAILGTFMWHLAGDVTDARQAKRLFSLFASAAIAGSVVGNLVTGPAARLLGTDNLLVLYALILLICAALTRTITREFTRPATRRKAGGFVQDIRAGYDYVRGSTLLRLIIAASVLFSILYFSISFLFSEAVSENIPDEAAIAGFLGVFTSIATGVTLLVSLFVANRLYARIGLVNAVFILPVTYLGGFILFGASFSLTTAVGVRLAQRVLLAGVASTAWNSFYNVVPSDRRGQVRTFDFGVPQQIGTVLSGVLLILGQTVLRRQQVFIIGFVVALVCSYLVWQMRKGYGQALVDALRAGRFEVFTPDERAFATFRGDANAIRVAQEALRDEKPSARRLGIELLAQMRAPSAASAIEQRLADPDAEVRVASARALADLDAEAATGSLLPLLADAEPDVRAATLDALLALRPEPTPQLLLKLAARLDDPSIDVQTRAAVALAGFGQPDRARTALHGLLSDPVPRTRGLALLALGELAATHDGGPAGPDITPVVSALDDAAASVRCAASQSLGLLRDEAALGPLVESLSDPDPTVRQAAAEALRQYGARATPRLLAVLEAGDAVACEAALDALSPNDPHSIEALHAYTRREIVRLRRWRGFLAAIPRVEKAGRASEFLCAMLETRAAESEQRLVKALGLLGDPAAMALVARGLRARDSETHAAAVEALETLGEKHLAREIIPLLEGAPAASDEQPLTTEEALRRLLAEADSWVRAVAARAIGELDLRALLPELRAIASDAGAGPLAREGALDGLARLGEGGLVKTLQTVSFLERVLLLREVPLFAALTPEDLKHIADVAREELHADGHELVREGDEDDALYVIAEGQVRVVKRENGDEKLLATRGAGDFIGEMAIIESEPRFATVRAVGDVRVLVIDAQAFDAILRDRPEVARALLRGLSRRLRESGTPPSSPQ